MKHSKNNHNLYLKIICKINITSKCKHSLENICTYIIVSLQINETSKYLHLFNTHYIINNNK